MSYIKAFIKEYLDVIKFMLLFKLGTKVAAVMDNKLFSTGYDNLGNLTGVSPYISRNWTYDYDKRILSINTTDVVFYWRFDTDGRLIRYEQGDGRSFDYEYNEGDKVIKITDNNGIEEIYG